MSSSGEEVVGPISEMVGADHVIATRMVVRDGRYTGEIEFYAYGAHKASAIADFARSMGYDLAACYAYSDSATDVPMLEAVGYPAAVNPDRVLRRTAVQRGWPVLAFSRTMSLRSRLAGLRTPPAQMVAGTAVGIGAAVVGLAWYAARRRRRVPPEAWLAHRTRLGRPGGSRATTAHVSKTRSAVGQLGGRSGLPNRAGSA